MSEADDVTTDLPDGPASFDHEIAVEHPQQIGRYRIEKVLGKGGFGLVYLAYDDQLDRRVAIKVPHARLINRPEDAEAYLTEARTVAGLDHPHIVPVYDVGSSNEFPCYIVSKYIEGSDLATRLKQSRLDVTASAKLVATVAEALHVAHKQGLVDRDVKPGNILLDQDDRPYVVDFGLALREADVGRGPRYAGTPAYMSPEQARGEGHRVDGRSDIYSLGAVLYELLTGRRTVSAENQHELLEQITNQEVKPPRQIDDRIPKELERICLKALAKRAADRYTTALDMAEDLRHCLASLPTELGNPSTVSSIRMTEDDTTRAAGDSGTAKGISTEENSHSRPIKIMPKGLRSFEGNDADFFLELLPGPRDREGLPDSIRFWKTRIEEMDADSTFSIGLIYGPSGCGKSSLVKAGLLPRLSSDVLAVYVEAAPGETETRLLYGLRKRCPALDANLSLKDTLAALRRGEGIHVGKKVLIVLDQFEQWLHANKEEDNTVLVQALRQCDGGRLQCIVMVRDDFWLAVTRFMGLLEVDLLQGQNTALADLFDLPHAEKVLSAFGRAFGTLPDNIGETTKEQKEFLKKSVAGLSEEGKVICVRLALFAEMMKGKAWTTATLKEVGGTTGIGITFLEETFSSNAAHPKHRLHQKAARAVLQDLLPDSGADIKGYMRSRAELLAASGYGNRPQDFDDLIRILDSEIRLITPTDPEGKDVDDALVQTETDQKYFQLTHDYLVHPLREWLTRKQKETRRGRAEIKLSDSAASWNSKPENRFLPSWWEYFSIRLLTDHAKWTEAQRRMMSRAGRVHGMRTAIAIAGLVLVVSAGAVVRSQIAERQEATRIAGLVGQLVSAEPSQIPEIVAELDGNPKVTATYLAPLLMREPHTVDEQLALLHARLAYVGRDSSMVEMLLEEMLTGRVTYVLPIRQMLRPYSLSLTERLGEILRNDLDPQRRFRAALVLADYVPELEFAWWTAGDLSFVAEQLVSSNAEYQPLLRDALKPIHELFLPDLERIFADAEASDSHRLSAANALADYAGSDIERLSQLLTVATAEQFAVLYPLFAANPSPSSVGELSKTAATLPPDELGSIERIAFGKRRANAAVTLLRLGEREQVIPVFSYTDDPEALTQFIFRCRERGVGVEPLLEVLDIVMDRVSEGAAVDINSDTFLETARARYALLLALGEFTLEQIPEKRRDQLLEKLADWYANDPSSGVHGAAGWLLRHWGQTEVATRIDQTPVPYSPSREWFTLAITVTPTQPQQPNDEATTEADAEEATAVDDSNDSGIDQEANSTKRSMAEPIPTETFYYTFIVFPAGDYMIGSMVDEPDRAPQEEREQRHQVTLTRPVAILDREVAMEELIAFQSAYAGMMQQLKSQPMDAGFGADWYDAVAFCRWLGEQMNLPEDEQAYASPDFLDPSEYPRESNPSADWAPRDWPVELDRRGFRLPTEAEWEVATRGGARTAYCYGSEVRLLGRFGWFTENSGKHVHPPKTRLPSIRGLFDLHGNLFEWTHNWIDDYSPQAVVDPTGPLRGSRRVIRGGSWGDDEGFCRTAARLTHAPTDRTGTYGFRLVLSPY